MMQNQGNGSVLTQDAIELNEAESTVMFIFTSLKVALDMRHN